MNLKGGLNIDLVVLNFENGGEEKEGEKGGKKEKDRNYLHNVFTIVIH